MQQIRRERVGGFLDGSIFLYPGSSIYKICTCSKFLEAGGGPIARNVSGLILASLGLKGGWR